MAQTLQYKRCLTSCTSYQPLNHAIEHRNVPSTASHKTVKGAAVQVLNIKNISKERKPNHSYSNMFTTTLSLKILCPCLEMRSSWESILSTWQESVPFFSIFVVWRHHRGECSCRCKPTPWSIFSYVESRQGNLNHLIKTLTTIEYKHFSCHVWICICSFQDLCFNPNSTKCYVLKMTVNSVRVCLMIQVDGMNFHFSKPFM